MVKIWLLLLFAIFLWITGCVPMAATPSATDFPEQLTPTAVAFRSTSPQSTPTVLSPTDTPSTGSGDAQAISPQNVDQVALLNRLGKGIVADVAFSPEGNTLAVVTSQGVYLYDAQTLSEITAYPNVGDITPVQITYNRQGDLLALGNEQDPEVCRLVLWKFSQGLWQHLGQVDAYSECLADAISPDGEYLAAANYDTRLATVWRTGDLSQVGAFPLEYDGDLYSILVQLAFSAVHTLATEAGNTVSVYDLETGALLHKLEMPQMTSFHRLAISSDGNVVAARDSAAQKIAIWNLSDGSAMTLDDAYEDWLVGAPLLLSPTGDLVAIGHNDPSGALPGGWVDLWQTGDGAALPRLSNPEWAYSPGLAFHPDGQTLITWQEGVDFWTAKDGTWQAVLPGYEWYDGVVSPDGALLAKIQGGQIRLIRLSDGQEVQTLVSAEELGPGTLVFSPDSSRLAYIHIPGMVEIWSVADGTLERAYDVPGSQGNFVLLPGGNLIAIDDPQTARVHVMNIWDGAILKTFPSPIQDEFGGLLAAVSLDGSLFALSAANTPIDVWRIGQDAPLYSLTSPFEWTSLSFSPDGKSLVTASDAVEVRNASDGKLRFRPAGVLTSYNNAMFSPDGTLIVTADQGRIHLWSLSDGSLQHSLEALPPALFTPDSALLIASGEDHIQFWQVSDGVLLRTLEATTLPTVISSDGQILISMRDGVVETWGVPAH